MIQLAPPLYSEKSRTTGGRGYGTASGSDGRRDATLPIPGKGGIGTNPEQLFAAGWPGRFEGATRMASGKRKIALPGVTAIDAGVGRCLVGGERGLRARLNISLSDLEREAALALVNDAHGACAYSKVTRGNVEIVIAVV
jgi:Ohr subfamily peroxiredoxin